MRFDPSDAEAHYCLARNYLLLGKRALAIEEHKILEGLNKDYAADLHKHILLH